MALPILMTSFLRKLAYSLPFFTALQNGVFQQLLNLKIRSLLKKYGEY